jgi:hypothetical protein
MKLIRSIDTYIARLDEKKFMRLVIIFIALMTFLVAGLIWWHYAAYNAALTELSEVNDARERTRIILEKAERVRQQKKMVDEILSKEPDFILAAVVNNMLSALNLQYADERPSETTLENNYRESSLNLRLLGITMQQLTELLYQVEQTNRLYVKDIEIIKSTKNPKTIDVTLTIATLLPPREGTTS